jgi:hypothetical protein
MSHEPNLYHVAFRRIGRPARRPRRRRKRPVPILTKPRTTSQTDRPAYLEDEDRPDLVCVRKIAGADAPCYGFGLSPEFDEAKFNVALFLDPAIPHWVDPIPSSEGLVSYRLEGPTRGGDWEEVTVTREADGSVRCSCWQSRDCDHVRALETAGLFTWYRSPYRIASPDNSPD